MTASDRRPPGASASGRGLVPPSSRDRRRPDRGTARSGSVCPAPGRPRCFVPARQDPHVRYLRSWESSEPCPPPSTVHGDDPGSRTDQRRSSSAPAPRARPTSRARWSASTSWRSTSSRRSSRRSRRSRRTPTGCSTADLTRPTGYERRVLKLLQWGEPPRPWRLKSPCHMLFSLDSLDRVFPDARFVMTHRDPTDVMLSVADVYADIVGGFSDDLDRATSASSTSSTGRWDGPGGRSSARRRRPPVLRHRLPRDAGRSDRRGARAVRLAR